MGDTPERGIDGVVLKSILATVDEAIHIVNTEGFTTYYSPAAARLDGLDQFEVIGKHLLQVYPSLSRETSTLLLVLRTRKPILNQQQTYVTRKGTAIHCINTTVPIWDGPDLVGALEISRDITSVKELSDTISNLREELYPPRPAGRAQAGLGARYTFDSIIGRDPKLTSVQEAAAKAAATTLPVFVYGETGTGKELLVEAIHSASHRHNGPFLAQNCSALPETLLEGIFFGTTRGGFTGATDRPGLFEMASGGTLYLDELNTMPLPLQSKLLRVVETGEVRRLGDLKVRAVDIRLISSSSLAPDRAIADGQLRADLYYRLSAVNLGLPPLRERRSDIPLLVEHMLRRGNARLGLAVRGCTPKAMDALLNHRWPGNVRELANAIEGAMALAGEPIIDLCHLPATVRGEPFEQAGGPLGPTVIAGPPPMPSGRPAGFGGLDLAIAAYERQLIEGALNEAGGNVSRAATSLGVPRTTLQYKLQVLGLSGSARRKTG
ncbi:MAG TPA: sigma 54-interacting transcriptional regulator [Bacillota bacterium]|jgi:arginine utilization regulatory protein